MTIQDEFEKKYNEPVDLDKVRQALKRFINGKERLGVPVSPDDDDMLICRLMDELKKYRGFRKSEDQEVYVVQGRSGIVFSATNNYEEALKIMNGLNEIEGDRGRMSYWKNNKLILQE